MILAAGHGRRLRPVTDYQPKPAVPFLNVPLLLYPLHLLQAAGVDEFIINAHRFSEQIEAVAHTSGATYKISKEVEAPLESGGGLRQAAPHLEGAGDFLVANGDTVIWPREPDAVGRLLATHRSSGQLGTLMVIRHPRAGRDFGAVWCAPEMQVRTFGRGHGPDGCEAFHYIGVMALSDRIFKFLPTGASNILLVLQHALTHGEAVGAVPVDATWHETGNEDDFLAATRNGLGLWQSGTTPDADWLRGLARRFWHPETVVTEAGGAVQVRAPGVHLGAWGGLQGWSVAGPGACIEAEVVDSVVLPGTRVREPVRHRIVGPWSAG